MEALLGTIEYTLPFLESVGIIGGLFFTGWSLWIDTRVRRIQNLLTLTAHHREIWSEVYKNPKLKRVVDPKTDLKRQSISIQERLFTRSLFLHLSTAYEASKTEMFAMPRNLQRDIRNFLKFPIPMQVWKQTREIQDRDFAEFVEDQIG